MQLSRHLATLDRAEHDLVDALHQVGERHRGEPDIAATSSVLGEVDERRRAALAPMLARYPDRSECGPPAARAPVAPGDSSLLTDLQDLHTLATRVNVAWAMTGQAARALRDEDLRDLADRADTDTRRHVRWLRGRINQAAAQALVLG